MWHQREYIELTALGEHAARRVYAKHQLLTRFFVEILRMPEAAARADACAMEHSLSSQGMEHLVRFFEFFNACPDGQDFLQRFHRCAVVHPHAPWDPGCADCAVKPRNDEQNQRKPPMSVAKLKPGQRGRVTQVTGAGAIRQRLLDMGILPDTHVEVERVAPSGDPIWIKVQGFQLALRRAEANAVIIAEA
jgi:Fe2+ transport system protein FeoA